MSPVKQNRQQFFAGGGSCVGCLHRRGNGDNAWCVNSDLPAEQRPYRPAQMRGCEKFKLASDNRGLREASMAKCLGRIAMRRAVRR